MVSFPLLQIRQQFAKIGIDSQAARQEMHLPRPDFEIETKPATLEVHYRAGEQKISQKASWEALGKGDVFQFTDRMAQEGHRAAMDAIANIVQRGNRMADIASGENVISNMALESTSEEVDISYDGPYSSHSVDLQYTPQAPEGNFTPAELDIRGKENPPEINYIPGSLDIYLLQKQSLEFIPPVIDLKA